MNTNKSNAAPIYVAMTLLSIAIFLVDLRFGLGVAVGVPYIAVVLLSRWLGRQRTVFVTAAGVTVLTVIGFFIPFPFIPFPEGPLIWIGVGNRFIALFAIWITAVFAAVLIRRNEAIREERDFNKSLVETAASIILLVDGDGRTIYSNPFTTAITGFKIVETQGQDWIETFVPEAQRMRVRRIFKSCVTGKMGQDAVFSIMTPQQEAMQFSWTSHVMTGAGGDVTGVLLIGHDITPLVEAQQRLLQSERLAAIGQTMASLSHEVRNELHSLQLGLLLLESQVTDSAALKVIGRVKGIEGRLTRLFEDIRSFAAPIQLVRSTVSLAEIWRRAWTTATSGDERRAELVEETGGEDFRLSVDVMRVEQVFRNLFDNSLAICPAPARITVCCSVVSRDENDFLSISIQDNGPGLSPEARKRVFEPFFTTKSVGTGLGMSISRRIIEAHGGDLQVGQNRDGAEFVIWLPWGENAEGSSRPIPGDGDPPADDRPS